MSQPTFFAGGSTPAVHDTTWMIEQKILGAILDGGGGGGGGASGITEGAGAPVNGVASTTWFYVDTNTNFKYWNIGTLASPVWIV